MQKQTLKSTLIGGLTVTAALTCNTLAEYAAQIAEEATCRLDLLP